VTVEKRPLEIRALRSLTPSAAGRITLLLEQGEYTRTPPLSYALDGVDAWLRSILEHEWQKAVQVVPPVYLYEFHDARIDRNGIMVLGDRFLVEETVIDYPKDADFDLGAVQFHKHTATWTFDGAQSITYIQAPTLLLIKHGFDNYGHWLIEMLPRLKLALEHLPSDVHVAVGDTAGPLWTVVLATLKALGFGPERIKRVTGASQFQTLYYVSPLSRHPLYISPFTTRFLAESYKSAPVVQSHRRLYVSRSDARFRRLRNEPELLDYLIPLGFEVVYPGQMSFADQVRVFSEAQLIVGVMGAAMTNMVFAPPGASVYALLPVTMPDLFFWNLACLNQQRYYEIRGPKCGDLDSLYADFTVDIASLRSAFELDQIGGGRTCRESPATNSSTKSEAVPKTQGRVSRTTLGLYYPEEGVVLIRHPEENQTGLTFSLGKIDRDLIPLLGDWNGDGEQGIGLYDPRSGLFALSNGLESATPEYQFSFGPGGMGWIPVVGDWDGDGIETVGLYHPADGAFFLSNHLAGGDAEINFRFGPANAGWLPLAGNWNRDGYSVGLYDPVHGRFFLRKRLGGDETAIVFEFGPANSRMVPLAGDWDGSGLCSVALYDQDAGIFYLRSSSEGDAPHIVQFGPTNEQARPLSVVWHCSSK